jgi:hypothetical protein
MSRYDGNVTNSNDPIFHVLHGTHHYLFNYTKPANVGLTERTSHSNICAYCLDSGLNAKLPKKLLNDGPVIKSLVGRWGRSRFLVRSSPIVSLWRLTRYSKRGQECFAISDPRVSLANHAHTQKLHVQTDIFVGRFKSGPVDQPTLGSGRDQKGDAFNRRIISGQERSAETTFRL